MPDRQGLAFYIREAGTRSHQRPGDGAGIVVDCEGEGFDPETAGNRLALSLVRNAVSGLRSERTEDGTPEGRISMCVRTE